MRTLRSDVLGAARRAAETGFLVAVVCAAAASMPGAAAAAGTVAWGTTKSAPSGTLGELFGVAAASSTDALAAGGFNPGEAPTALLTRPYAEHWTGSGWSATSVPLATVYPSGQQTAQLNGVTERTVGDGWAVGTVADTSSYASQTLAYHWNGMAWKRSPTPNPAGATLTNQLDAVAARASNDVWAVGGDRDYPEVSLVLHWNGTAWRQVTVPNIGPLDAVAVSTGVVYVAGGDRVEEFNGTAWTKLPVPPSAGLITGLADTAGGLWAVGYVDFACGEGTCTHSYAAVWNGATWTVTPAGGGTGLTDVVGTGSQVLASSADGKVLRLTLSGAVPQVTPQIDGQLNAIAATPTGAPWAVGWMITNTATRKPAIINAPGIGQGGIIVTTGASDATVTWTGPASGAGSTDQSGRFVVGGLPDGSYSITASLPGCQPGVTTAQVTAGTATAVNATISCPP